MKVELGKRSGIIIPTKYKDCEFYTRIKAHLIRRYKQFNSEDYVTNIFYLESEKYLVIPRFFPLDKYITNYIIKDLSHDGDNIDISHSIKPRDDLQIEAMKFMMDNDSGTIQLKPGVGKTIIAIRTIAIRGKKSLIIMHRDSLVQQWKARFHQFTNLADDDVSILSSSSFNDDLEKPIIIATAQTFKSLLKRRREDFLLALHKANIGILIGDEVHTSIGAPSFSECSVHLPCKVVFGLSATPGRADGNSDIITYHCGKVWAVDDTSVTMEANVTMMLMDFQVDQPIRKRWLYWEGKFQRSRYLNIIKNSKRTVAVMEGLLNKLVKNKDIIFVTERIKLIDLLYDKIDIQSKSKFIAGSSNDELEEQLVFSTPGKIRDGVDIPKKDCLVMTSPISNIEQICGRVTRASEGKQTPSIIDMVDYGCEPIAKTFFKRKKYYHDMGWKINFMIITPQGEMVKIEESEAIKIIQGE